MVNSTREPYHNLYQIKFTDKNNKIHATDSAILKEARKLGRILSGDYGNEILVTRTQFSDHYDALTRIRGQVHISDLNLKTINVFNFKKGESLRVRYPSNMLIKKDLKLHRDLEVVLTFCDIIFCLKLPPDNAELSYFKVGSDLLAHGIDKPDKLILNNSIIGSYCEEPIFRSIFVEREE